MRRVLLHQLLAVGQFKIGKVEARCYRAAHQRIALGAGYLTGKPGPCRHQRLWHSASLFPQFYTLVASILKQYMHLYGGAFVMVPAFVAGYAVKGGEMARSEQKVNHGSRRPWPGWRRHQRAAAIGFGIKAALGVGLQVQLLHQLLNMVHDKQNAEKSRTTLQKGEGLRDTQGQSLLSVETEARSSTNPRCHLPAC
jgi:hypothetical protein